jgi:hypothetical protein
MAAYPLFKEFDERVRDLKPEYILDGRRTTTLEAFYNEIGQTLLAGQRTSMVSMLYFVVIMGTYLKSSD